MRTEFKKTATGLGCLLLLAPLCFALHVAEFGAVPDDGLCDMEALGKAVQTAISKGETEVLFDAGTYNLRNTCTVPGKGHNNYIVIDNAENLALIGKSGSDGRPATRLERNLVLNNDSMPPIQVNIAYSKRITLKNLILANNPPLGSTGRVVSVDKNRDEVIVEVLAGLPAYDGMRCASAHVWNLETGMIKSFGTTPDEGTLTIGLDIKAFWAAVPGTDARQLKMRGAGFARKVDAGDGISWHHKSSESFNQIEVMRSENIIFDNILLPNVSNAGMLFGYNRNITLRKVRFEPENGNLAVGGRDGIHLSNSSGGLLVEDCFFKGLRMDPLVLRKTFGIVQEVCPDGSIISKPGYTVPAGDKIRFWTGDEPQDRVIESIDLIKGGLYHYVFKEALPPGVTKGTAISFQTYALDKGVIRNCVFEGNFGSAIVNFEENITVEKCTFRNNSYQIKYGSNQTSGAFVRNNIFRNNVCEDAGWIDIARRGQPAALVIHSLCKYFKDPRYNQHIEIYGNVFKNPCGTQDAVAIHVLNAEDVNIYGNVFEGFNHNVLVDGKTTRNIHIQ